MVVSVVLALLLQTCAIGYTHDITWVPLRMLVFFSLFLSARLSPIVFLFLLDSAWFSLLGLMNISHALGMIICMLVIQLLVDFVKITSFTMWIIVSVITCLSLSPIVQWTFFKIIANLIGAALVALYLTRYGKQSRELF